MKRILPTLGLLALLGACGDDDDDNGSSGPVGQCEAFRDTFCRRLQECSGLDIATCTRDFDSTINCGLAVDVGPTYDECLQAVSGASCEQVVMPTDEIVPLPSSCDGIILTE